MITFIYNKASLHCFIYLLVKGVLIFNILDSISQFSVKRNNYCSFLHWLKWTVATDPDRQAVDADADLDPPKWWLSDRIRIHNTDPNRVNPTIIPILPPFPCELIQLIFQVGQSHLAYPLTWYLHGHSKSSIKKEIRDFNNWSGSKAGRRRIKL